MALNLSKKTKNKKNKKTKNNGTVKSGSNVVIHSYIPQKYVFGSYVHEMRPSFILNILLNTILHKNVSVSKMISKGCHGGRYML